MMGIDQNRPFKVILMSTNYIGFGGELMDLQCHHSILLELWILESQVFENSVGTKESFDNSIFIFPRNFLIGTLKDKCYRWSNI